VAGVRNLEREIAALCRKTAVTLVEGDDPEKTFHINRHKLAGLLGVKKYRYDEREKEARIGVCAGLAYTQTGGDILLVETAILPGRGKVVTTGQLGDVMKESAQAAFSYVRSGSDRLGLRADFHKTVDVHVHVPAGATPKDGPSAGITLATSIVSALIGVAVRPDIAMTGEITLRGRVLPIGGLREKLLAARRGLITTVIVPRDNEKDLKEVPEEILKDLEIVFVDHIDEVLPLALVGAPGEIFSGQADCEPLFKTLRRDAAAPCPATDSLAQ
jgi:ATP-dependent Lon protease